MFAFHTLGLAAALVATSATAQQYPTKSITMLVPYAAGGPTDTVARVVAQSMAKPLGQTVIVENKPSAGGILAPEQVKNAKPDGYTITDPSRRHGKPRRRSIGSCASIRSPTSPTSG